MLAKELAEWKDEFADAGAAFGSRSQRLSWRLIGEVVLFRAAKEECVDPA